MGSGPLGTFFPPGPGGGASSFTALSDTPTDYSGAALKVLSVNAGATAVEFVTVTGTGSVVRATSPTIVTPTIASFANAPHDHSDAAGGGVLVAAAVDSFAFVDGGNAFGANAMIGTTDAFSVIIQTGGVELSRFINGVGYIQGATSFVDANTFFQIDTNANTLRRFRFRNLSSGGSHTADVIVGTGNSELFLRAGSGVTEILQNVGTGIMRIGTNTVAAIDFITAAGGSNTNRLRIGSGSSSAAQFLIGPVGHVLSAHFIETGRNSNGAGFINIRNGTNGTAARSGYSMTTDAGNAEIFVASPLYTGTGGADTFSIQANSNVSGGIEIRTMGATPIKLQTNGENTRYTVESNGDMTMEGEFDFIPATDGQGEVGIDAKKFLRVKAITGSFGDLELCRDTEEGPAHWLMREFPDRLELYNKITNKHYRMVLEEVA